MKTARDVVASPHWRLTTLSIAIFFFSASVLCLQLVHMRVLSFAMWQSLVYSVITFALLGFGMSGVVLAVWPNLLKIRQEVLLASTTLLFALSNCAGMYLSTFLHADAFNLLENPRVLIPVTAYFFLLVVPYFLGGTVLAVALARNSAISSFLYGANMLGSGAGCVAFLFLITPLGAPKLIVVVSVVASLCAALFAGRVFLRGAMFSLACAALFIPLASYSGSLFRFTPCESKNFSQLAAEDPEMRVEFTQWTPTGRIDVVSSPALSYINPDTHKRFATKELYTDGDAFTRLFQYAKQGDDPFIPTAELAINTAYSLLNSPEVLIIGVGGGKEVLEALEYGAKRVVGVELNPATVDVVNHVYAGYLGHIGANPRASVVLGEGRSYASRCRPESFDLVYMNGVDTWAALSSGAYTLAENYLYTVNALQDYLRLLRPDGLISISRYEFQKPRETLRLAITALEALRREGVPNPEQHLAVMINVDWGTVLVKKSPFTQSEIDIIERKIEKGFLGVVYRPGLENEPLDALHRERYGDYWLSEDFHGALNPLVAFVQHFKARNEEPFYSSYQYYVRPVSDDDPFFFRYYKFSSLLFRTADGLQWNAAGGSLALLVLLVLLCISSVAVLVFIFLPLILSSRKHGALPMSWRSVGYAVYFASLGSGYMLVEISLMQKLSLFLGHPTYSIATVLASMLVFSGLGSMLSGRIRIREKSLIALCILVVALLLAAYAGWLTEYLHPKLALSVFSRNAIAIAIVAPLAFFMGMPFPVGLRAVTAESEVYIPWVWGVNGAAGVLASVGAIIAAMNLGFTAVLFSSVIVYVGGLVAMLLIPSRQTL